MDEYVNDTETFLLRENEDGTLDTFRRPNSDAEWEPDGGRKVPVEPRGETA